MVDGRLQNCRKMCSHGNQKLFYPEDAVPFLWAFTTTSVPNIKGSLNLNCIDLGVGIFQQEEEG